MFNVTDPDGKRISLFVEEGNAMLAFYDSRNTPRFLIAVTPDGGAVMSALEADYEKKTSTKTPSGWSSPQVNPRSFCAMESS
jgi:hypothetical protein